MKPARFILNTDYTTVRNTGHKTLSITIPDSITVPSWQSEHTIATAYTTIDSENDAFMTYFSSSRYNYITPGDWGVTIPDGATTTSVIEDVSFEVTIDGNTVTLRAYCINGMQEEDVYFNGYGQTITAHIITYKDPFNA